MAARKTTAKKTTTKKKNATRKVAAKKAAARKAAPKKTVAKKVVTRKAAPRKPAPRKPAPRRAFPPLPALPGMPRGMELLARVQAADARVLKPGALAFLSELERRFGAARRDLLRARVDRQKRLDRGEKPDFLPETRAVREGDWRVAPVPAEIQDRRVEITGPVDRKMVINALNCGAKVFMADFEDASTPTWANLIEGQANLIDAVRRDITYTDPATQRFYELNADHAVLFVRPRGLHMDERHVRIDGRAMSASLFDFGLFIFHNGQEQVSQGGAPYFYLPKLESHLEARWWRDVFLHAEEALGLKRGTIKATVLIETILAAFEMDEILHELREHSAGLNCGRWDYIYSYIKKFAEDPNAVLPDRGQVTMAVGMMSSYSQLLIKTCHRRDAHAMGGMAAQIPIKDDPAANEAAMARVRADKEREASNGHDGTWVAHPGLVAIAQAEFDRAMPGPNQIARKRQDVNVSAADLLTPPTGTCTEAGLRQNVNVGIGYIEAWLRGTGCVPLYNLMEDAATAEISRAQVWQQIRHKVKLDDGTVVTKPLCRRIVAEELAKTRKQLGAERFKAGRYKEAASLFTRLIEARRFPEFLTLPAYEWVVAEEGKRSRP